MVKATQEKISTLESENAALRQKIAAQEAAAVHSRNFGGSITEEMRKIRSKGKNTAHSIVVYEQNDHKNISLWTKWGDRIGPMHPDNAIQTLHNFADMGIILSVDAPTAEQSAAFWASPEGKAFAKDRALRRSRKEKTRKGNSLERITEAIAKITGQSAAQINRVLSPGEVA